MDDRDHTMDRGARANDRPPCDYPDCIGGLPCFDYQTAAIIRATKSIEGTIRAKDVASRRALLDVAARPIRKVRETLEIGLLVLDTWKLVRGSELAPADAGRAVEHERGVGPAFAD